MGNDPSETDIRDIPYITILLTNEGVEGEEGLISLDPPSTAHKVYSTSLYKVAADNLGS